MVWRLHLALVSVWLVFGAARLAATTVSGRLVLGESGAPAKGLLVRAGLESGQDPVDRRTTRTAAIDEAGRFLIRLPTVPGRVYRMLVADAQGRIVAGWTGLAGAADHDLGTAVLRCDGRLSGSVCGADGAPVPGALVRLDLGLLQGPPAAGSFVAAAQATTAGDGGFAFTGLARGSYRVWVLAPGWARQELPVQVGDAAAVVGVRLAAGATLEGQVRDERGDPVAGVSVAAAPGHAAPTDQAGRYRLGSLPVGAAELQVTADGYCVKPGFETRLACPAEAELVLDIPLIRAAAVAGQVTDETGAPVADAYVGMASGDSTAETWTDTDGRYALTPRLPGQSELWAWHEGAVPMLQRLRLEPGVTAAATLVLGQGSRLAGKVLTAELQPAAGLQVHASPMPASGPATGPGFGFRLDQTTTTAPDGGFLLSRLSSLDYRVEVTRGSGETAELEVVLAPVRPGRDDLQLILPRRLAVNGRVTDEQGTPLAGVQLATRRQGDDERPVGASGDDGTFQLDLHAGARYVLTGRRWPLLERSTDLDLTEPAPGPVHLALRYGCRVSGTVRGRPGGQPVPGLAVAAYASLLRQLPGVDPQATTGQDRAGLDRTDSQGRFHLEGLPPGIVEVRVFDPAVRPRARRCVKAFARLVAETPADLALEWPEVSAVRGTVRDPDGEPQPRPEVCLMPLTGDPTRDPDRVTANADGGFEFRHVLPGRYLAVAVARERAGPAHARPELVTVTADAAAEIELCLPIQADTADVGLTRTGSVRINGEPLVRGGVRFLAAPDQDAHPWSTWGHGLIDARVVAGTFSLAGLRPDDYLCSVYWAVRDHAGGATPEAPVRAASSLQRIAVDPGQTTLRLDLTGGRVTTRITTPEGQAAVNAWVALVPAALADALTSSPAAELVGTGALTDRTGSCVFDCVRSGTYHVVFGDGTDIEGLVEAVPVSGPQTRIEGRLEPRRGVHVSVTDAAGSPAVDATVLALCAPGITVWATPTDEPGRFAFADTVLCAAHRIYVSSPGHAIETWSLAASSGASHSVALEPGGDLAVQVRSGGEPVPGQRLVLSTMDGAEVRRESGAFLLRCGPDERRCLNRPTTADGRTMLLGLRPGRYRVTVAGQAAAVTAEVQALTTTEVVLDL